MIASARLEAFQRSGLRALHELPATRPAHRNIDAAASGGTFGRRASGAWLQAEHAVGAQDGLGVVFDHQDGDAEIAQADQGVEELAFHQPALVDFAGFLEDFVERGEAAGLDLVTAGRFVDFAGFLEDLFEGGEDAGLDLVTAGRFVDFAGFLEDLFEGGEDAGLDVVTAGRRFVVVGGGDG